MTSGNLKCFQVFKTRDRGLFEIVVIIQSVFHLKIYQNKILLFLKNYF